MTAYNSALKALSLSVAAVALTSGAAFAATPIYSGGGTYAYSALRAIGDCAGTPFNNGAATTTACTTNAAYPYEYLFAGVGSGAGLTALLGETSPTATASSGGADAYNGIAYPYAKWTFTDSDAPLDSLSELNDGNTWFTDYVGATPTTSGTKYNRGAVWQIPEAAAPMTLPYNLGTTTFTNASSVTGVTNELDLTKDAVCYIWTQAKAAGTAVSGPYDWSNPIFQPAYSAAKKPVLTQLGSNIASVQGGSLAIQPIHRPDASGSTYVFTLWLQTNCKGYTAAGYSTPATVVTWPSYVTAAASTGGGGMQKAVAATVGGIGYVDPSKVQPLAATGPAAAFVASTTSTVKAPQFVYPTVASVKAAFANPKPPVYNAAYAAWGKTLNKAFFHAGAGAYQITGLTYIMGYQCYSTNSNADNFDGVLDYVKFITTNSQAEAVLESKGLVGMGASTAINANGNTFLQAELALLTDTTNSAKTAIVGLNDSQIGSWDVKNAKGVVTKHYNGPTQCRGYFADANRT